MGFKEEPCKNTVADYWNRGFDLPLDPILRDAFLVVVLKSFPNLVHTIVCCVLERVFRIGKS